MFRRYGLDLLIFVIIFLTCEVRCKVIQRTNETDESNFPKRIWLLWFQGWNNAPDLVKKVKDSWKFHNPAWEVVLLDDKNLKKYVKIDLPSIAKEAAKSDLIRLYLLRHYGGVWADATMVCLWPLDMWVNNALQPEGFWMYHGRDRGRGPASWFILSTPSNYLIRTWYESAIEFWNNNPLEYSYFWMDEEFAKLCISDKEFLRRWKEVPYKYAEAETGPHVLTGQGKVFTYDQHLIAKIQSNPPFAMKLSHHGSRKKFNRQTNAYQVIQLSLRRNRGTIQFIAESSPNFTNATFL